MEVQPFYTLRDQSEWLRKAIDVVARRTTEGKSCNPEEIWAIIRSEQEPEIMPKDFLTVFEDSRFKKLVELHLRKMAVKDIEHLPIVRQILSEAALLTNISILEDLVVNPADIPFGQRRLLAKDLNRMLAREMNLAETKEEKEEVSPYDAAMREDAALQELLSKYPKEMHESILKKWKLERMRYINNEEHKVRSIIR
jgi:hypothetical protein